MTNVNRKVLLLTGPGGAGKTTIADLLVAKYDFVKIDGDQLDTEFFPEGGQWLPENLEKLKLAHQKIFNEVKRESVNSNKNIVLDYIIFGDYLNFLQMFRKEFGDKFVIKVLFPIQEETVKRDKKRKCWTTGAERITQVMSEFENLKDIIGENNFIDTTNETPHETLKKYFNHL